LVPFVYVLAAAAAAAAVAGGDGDVVVVGAGVVVVTCIGDSWNDAVIEICFPMLSASFVGIR